MIPVPASITCRSRSLIAVRSAAVAAGPARWAVSVDPRNRLLDQFGGVEVCHLRLLPSPRGRLRLTGRYQAFLSLLDSTSRTSGELRKSCCETTSAVSLTEFVDQRAIGVLVGGTQTFVVGQHGQDDVVSALVVEGRDHLAGGDHHRSIVRHDRRLLLSDDHRQWRQPKDTPAANAIHRQMTTNGWRVTRLPSFG